MPPQDQLRLGPMYITSGNSGAIAIARQIPEARPSTRRSTDYASHCGVGTRSKITHSQWSCLFPSLSQPTLNLLFTYLGLPNGKRSFSLVVTGGTSTCELLIDSQVL